MTDRTFKATVKSYDPRERWGVVEGAGKVLRFSITCFYAGAYSRAPREGEVVEVVVSKDPGQASSSDITAVRVRAG